MSHVQWHDMTSQLVSMFQVVAENCRVLPNKYQVETKILHLSNLSRQKQMLVDARRNGAGAKNNKQRCVGRVNWDIWDWADLGLRKQTSAGTLLQAMCRVITCLRCMSLWSLPLFSSMSSLLVWSGLLARSKATAPKTPTTQRFPRCVHFPRGMKSWNRAAKFSTKGFGTSSKTRRWHNRWWWTTLGVVGTSENLLEVLQ